MIKQLEFQLPRVVPVAEGGDGDLHQGPRRLKRVVHQGALCHHGPMAVSRGGLAYDKVWVAPAKTVLSVQSPGRHLHLDHVLVGAKFSATMKNFPFLLGPSMMQDV